jgi:hypothetical protein
MKLKWQLLMTEGCQCLDVMLVSQRGATSEQVGDSGTLIAGRRLRLAWHWHGQAERHMWLPLLELCKAACNSVVCSTQVC